ncbi:hypothetical protein CHKEEEPN_1873 [Methylorubrum podarium]|nr:hypothetical protein CHKEEEPN_1873 [Methylorubrum podarium]
MTEDRKGGSSGPVLLAVFSDGYGGTVAKKSLARASPHAVPPGATQLPSGRETWWARTYQKLRCEVS